jgi:hypothetical protein
MTLERQGVSYSSTNDLRGPSVAQRLSVGNAIFFLVLVCQLSILCDDAGPMKCFQNVATRHLGDLVGNARELSEVEGGAISCLMILRGRHRPFAAPRYFSRAYHILVYAHMRLNRCGVPLADNDS